MFDFTFPKEDVTDYWGVGWAGRGVETKKGRWNI